MLGKHLIPKNNPTIHHLILEHGDLRKAEGFSVIKGTPAHHIRSSKRAQWLQKRPSEGSQA